MDPDREGDFQKNAHGILEVPELSWQGFYRYCTYLGIEVYACKAVMSGTRFSVTKFPTLTNMVILNTILMNRFLCQIKNDFQKES